jgi:hypothetical protein
MQQYSKEYFELLKEFSTKFINFIQKLQSDKSFCSYVLSVKGIENLTVQGDQEAIKQLFLVDVCKCFNLISNIYDIESKECFAINYLLVKQLGLEINEYEHIQYLYSADMLSSFKQMYESLKPELKDTNIDNEVFFRLSYILNAYNKELKEEYLSNMYQFASIVVKADGVVTPKEEEVLKKIMKTPDAEDKSQDHASVTNDPGKDQSLEEVLDELNSLTGLEKVKEEVNSLTNFIRIQKAREAAGLKASNVSYHVVFTGNPGTGKTTVARIVSKIYKSLGVLSQGQLVETDRAGLVGQYVGHTAPKVHKAVDDALNGVLFIDEAYALNGSNQDSFGKEAIDTLIKRMEDDRDKVAVILAGYTEDMNKFMDTNPGFKSRINRYIEFSDYEPEELLSIFKSLSRKLDYHLTDEATRKVYLLFEEAYLKRDASFGNGRFVRNVFEKTLEGQANRLAGITTLSKEVLTTIHAEDIP